MLTTFAEGDPKAPFSIGTTPKCRAGCYSFPLIAPLKPWPLHYNTYIEPQSPGPLENSLLIRPSLIFKTNLPYLIHEPCIIKYNEKKPKHINGIVIIPGYAWFYILF